MKVFLIAFAAIVIATLATVAGVSLTRGAPAREAVHETRPLAGFHQIDVAGQVTVTLVQGESEGVSLDAPASIRVRTEVRNGTLVIEAEDRRHAWEWLSGRASRASRVTINVRNLDRIETAGAVTVVADKLAAEELRIDLSGASTVRIGELEATALKLDGTGATKVEIAGKVARQEVRVSGAGSYDAGRLASAEASVDVSGAGKAVVDARDRLSVAISGAGKVEYSGNPKVKQTISGIGKVTRRDRG